jgi:hypothetical protein
MFICLTPGIAFVAKLWVPNFLPKEDYYAKM